VEWQVAVEATEYKAFYIHNHPRIFRGPRPWEKALDSGWEIAIEGEVGSAADQVAYLKEEMGGWKWVGPWADRAWKDSAVRWPIWILLSGVLLEVISLLLSLRRSLAQYWRPAWRAYLLLIPPVLSALFWFWSAPAPRLGIPVLWLVALSVWMIAVARLQIRVDPAIGATLVVGVITIVCLLSFALEPVVWLRSVEANGFRSIPEAAITRVASKSGGEIKLPRKDRRCWDTPLPSSPYVDPALELRDPDRGIAGGFKVNR
jgi:hypothetical protein